MSKILILNKYYTNVIGGVETVVKDYALILSKSHDVTILACNNKSLLPTFKYKEFDNIFVVISSTLFIFKKLPISISFVYYFFKLVREVDIIYLHEPFPLGTLLSLFIGSKKKIIVTWHSDIYKQRILSKIVEPLQKLVLNKAQKITTTSNNLLINSKILSRFIDKVSIIPLSIDINNVEYNINNVDPLLIKYVNEKVKFCLYFGRLSYYKGIDLIIESFKMNTTNPTLIFGVGESKIENNLNQLMQSYPDNFLFVNRYVNQDEKIYLLSKACVFLFPSTKVTEAFGITQLEAMNMGVPVINCNIATGVPWVSLDDVTGITIDNGSAIQLSLAINQLLSNLEKCRNFGLNGKNRVKDFFSKEINDPKILELINNL